MCFLTPTCNTNCHTHDNTEPCTFPATVQRQWLHGSFDIPLLVPIQYSISGTPVEPTVSEGTAQGQVGVPDKTGIGEDKGVGKISAPLKRQLEDIGVSLELP